MAVKVELALVMIYRTPFVHFTTLVYEKTTNISFNDRIRHLVIYTDCNKTLWCPSSFLLLLGPFKLLSTKLFKHHSMYRGE